MDRPEFPDYLQDLVKNYRDTLAVVDSRGDIQYITPSVQGLLGYPPEHFLGTFPEDTIHSEDLLPIREIIGEIQAGRRREGKKRFRCRRKDGVTIWLEALIQAFPDPGESAPSSGESAPGAVIICREITEQVETEQDLRKSDARFRTLLERFPLPAYLWRYQGDDFVLADVNPAAEALSRGQLRDQLGIAASQFFMDQSRIREAMSRCRGEQKPTDFEHSLRLRTTQEQKTLHSYLVPLPEDFLIVFSRDITRDVKIRRRNEILARFPEQNPNPVMRLSYQGSVLYSNRAAQRLLYQWRRLGEKSAAPGRLPDFWLPILREIRTTGRAQQKEIFIEDRLYLFSLAPLAGEDMVYLYGFDITGQEEAEKKLRLSSRIFDATIEGISVTDPKGTIQSVNPAFSRITGYTAEEALGKNPRILKSDRHEPAFYEKMWRQLQEEGSWEGEIWNRRKDGETYPEWLSINALRDDVGHIQHYVAVFNDISEIKMKEMELHYRAFHDPLTGLPNRNLLDDRIEQFLTRLQRERVLGALVFMDLDRFKVINDSLGHIVGDYLLQEIAGRIKECIRGKDTVTRVGGDEFVLLLTDLENPREAGRICQRIIDVLKTPFEIQGHTLHATASIGVALIEPDRNPSQTELYKHADIAMYRVKNQGGQNYGFYANQDSEGISQQLLMENRLRMAVEKQAFQVVYQPIVETQTGTAAGAEALLRWEDEELGRVSPGVFIPLAEELGLITEITHQVMIQACRDNREWERRGFSDLSVSVNISSRDFADGRISTMVDQVLAETGIPANQLILEVTENSLMRDVEAIIPLMDKLREKGIRFSIDDFGTGYSSLSYLKRFPLDKLKIDQSFVADLPEDQESLSIARTILGLAEGLGLQTISEGVETREQLQFFRDEGGSFIQGYYFSPPLPQRGFLELLQGLTGA